MNVWELTLRDLFNRMDDMARGVEAASALGAGMNLAAKQALDQLQLRKMLEYDLPQILAKHQREMQEAQNRHEINRLLAVSQQLPALFSLSGMGSGGSGFRVRDASGAVTASVSGGGGGSGMGGMSAVALGARGWVPSGRGNLVSVRLPRARYHPTLGWQFRPWGR